MRQRLSVSVLAIQRQENQARKASGERVGDEKIVGRRAGVSLAFYKIKARVFSEIFCSTYPERGATHQAGPHPQPRARRELTESPLKSRELLTRQTNGDHHLPTSGATSSRSTIFPF